MKKIVSAILILTLILSFGVSNNLISVFASVLPSEDEGITSPVKPENPDSNKDKPFNKHRDGRKHKHSKNDDKSISENNSEKIKDSKTAPEGGEKKPRPPKDKTKPIPKEMLKTQARAAYLMDFKSGTVLYKQNEKERYPIASMCKIMSLILIFENLENGNFEECEEITVSENASSMGGSQVFLEANGNYKICDLIKSIIVASANDATVAMSELIAGSEEGFVAMMNDKADELGLPDTNFINSTGLPQAGQYSCAEDVANMTKIMLSHSGYFKYSRIWMDKIIHKEGRETEISNTNKLVKFYKGCDGGKTGFTSEAKHCVSATAERNGMRLISVILGAEDGKTRFAEASKLLNYGFAGFASRQLVYKERTIEIKLCVKGGKEKILEIVPEENYSVLINKSDKVNFVIDYKLPDKIAAPVKKGQVVGTLSIISENNVIKEIKLLAAASINKNSYGDIIYDIIQNW